MNKLRTGSMEYGYINVTTTVLYVTGHPAGAEAKEKL